MTEIRFEVAEDEADGGNTTHAPGHRIHTGDAADGPFGKGHYSGIAHGDRA